VLRLLLDHQMSKRVAQQVRAHRPECVIESVTEWEAGRYRDQDDRVILQAACRAGFALVTYDRRTIEPLLVEMAWQAESHTGVLFIDERTIPQSDIGGQVRALLAFWDAAQEEDWGNRAGYLRPAG
jgi:predicted nuclease of predicted toxin-antitoxin system